MNPLVIFDGLCNFCSHSVRIILKNDKNGSIHFASLQSRQGADILMKYGIDSADTDSFVVIKDEHAYLKSDAALEIARELRFPWRLAATLRFLPRSWRDFVYGVIAKIRYRWFGKRDTCFVPTKEERGRFLDSGD